MKKFNRPRASRALIRVGGGRGFVVEAANDGRKAITQDGEWPVGRRRLVITAAHCLPRMPSETASLHDEQLLFSNLLGALGNDPHIWAECCFVDPVSDLAVLRTPDSQELYQEAEAYDELVDGCSVLSVADQAEGSAWWLSLEGTWRTCTVGSIGDGSLWVEQGADNVQFGMSGSPILSSAGAAIGAVSTVKGGNPRLAVNLPGWLLRQLGLVQRPLRAPN